MKTKPGIGIAGYATCAWIAFCALALVLVGLPGLVSPPERKLVSAELVGDAAMQAVSALTPQQREVLLTREQDRLQAEPLDSSALDNLSLLELLANNPLKADEFATESARRSLRNTLSQLTVMGSYLKNRDYGQAMYHFDVVLTSEPNLAKQLIPGIAGFLTADPPIQALAKVLIRRPAWRTTFFFWLFANDKSDQIAFRLFNALRKNGGAPADGELKAYIDTLLRHKAYDRAYYVWLDSLDENELKKVGNVFDGGFDLEPKNFNFDWTLRPFANADMGVVARGNNSVERALRLSFYNSAGLFSNVFQFLRLQPGTYRLAGEVSSQDFKSLGGLMLTVSCADSGSLLASSQRFDSRTPWSAFAFDFQIPAQSCQLPMLRLQSASSAVLDSGMNGTIMFDNIKIDTVDVTQP